MTIIHKILVFIPIITFMSCNFQNGFFVNKGSSSTINSSINFTSSEKSVTSSKRIPVTISFVESVADFTSSDVVVTGAALQNFTGVGKTYSFVLIPYSTNISVQILSGSVTFSSGEKNNSSKVFSFVSTSKFAPVYGGCYHPDFFRSKFLPLGF